MPRRWIELLRTTSARLALLYAGLFAVSVTLLFGLIYWAATTALSERIDQDLVLQRDALMSNSGTAEKDVATAIRDALQRPHGGFRYLVRDSAGTTLAGDLPASPTWYTGYQDIELAADASHSDDEPRVFRALGHPLAEGGLLVIAQDAYALDELRELIARAFGWGAGATLVLAGIGGGIIVKRVMHRIEVINRASERIMTGDLTGRLPVSSGSARGDEFDRLADNLNRMLDRIEKLVEGLRQVSTDIAHDLRTPLARLRRNLEAARDTAANHASSAHLRAIDTAVTQADELLATFAGLLRIAQLESRAAHFMFTTVDLCAIVESVVEVYRPAAEEKRQTLDGQIAGPAYVAGDRPLLTRMVANLVENAVRHSPEGASILVELKLETGEGPVMTITDNGPGIPLHERENVFRRFYRLDASRHSPGNGLGLPLVAAIAEVHGISVGLTENVPRGLRVALAFSPHARKRGSPRCAPAARA